MTNAMKQPSDNLVLGEVSAHVSTLLTLWLNLELPEKKRATVQQKRTYTYTYITDVTIIKS
jgi:hypothetical protein